RDMVRVLRQRWPAVRILLVDAVVQGDEAAPSLCHALAAVNRLTDVDVILFGRGGGSLEDLWAFNEEAVARAIHTSRIPVVSAVGHESDVTIADLVADARASTPTHAAELAVPDRVETERHLTHLERRLAGLLERRLEAARAWLRGITLRRVFTAPGSLLEQRAQRIDDLDGRMARALAVRAERARQRLAGLSQTLAALDPTAVLSRGYAIFTREVDGAVVTQPADMPAGSEGTVRVAGGAVPVVAR
ncbi:MAG: exodeoxyribonuclease VII large subunit, partial [Armatimonadetes bacterium]|nr:exodeoxyribonuclease VII large subunit [Armatimonadota bacterium]